MPLSMCTVWPSHSKWLSERSNEAWTFLHRNYLDDLKATAVGTWWLAASSPQHSRSYITSHVEFFGKTASYSDDSVPLQPRFGVLGLLVFPKAKITFEREEISDHQWDPEKYDGTADGDWENCVRSQGTYFEGDWGTFVISTMFLVSSSMSLFFIVHGQIFPGQTSYSH